LQLTRQIDKLMMAVQYTPSGKFPMIIVVPNNLHDILRNISLCLHRNYELVAGTKLDNIHWYYELIRVTVVGSIHGIQLIMEIPLKTASQ